MYYINKTFKNNHLGFKECHFGIVFLYDLYDPGLCFFILVDVEGFLQFIEIANHGPIANANVDFIQEVWWKMQENIVG